MATSKAEYLKRYMTAEPESDNTVKRKKRRKKIPAAKINSTGFKIVDEDIGLSNIQGGDEEMAEEEPTVAELVDERPDTVKLMEEYDTNKKWKKITTDTHANDTNASDRQRHNASNSPPRRPIHNTDNSPPRRQIHNSDNSPPHRQRHDSDNSPPRKQRHDLDNSPPRRQRHDSNNSPPRRQRHDSDNSPPRRQRHDSDNSPPRRPRNDQTLNSRTNKPSDGTIQDDLDQSPSRRTTHNSSSDTVDGATKKTLSGKIAGLSSAKDMKAEAERLKLKELEMFNKIGDDRLGKNAETIFRDRKTGKKRDLKSEKQQDDAKNAEWKSKYDNWAKGIVQGTAEQERVAEMAHEMNKPLARAKDDTDLDAYLKEQDREGDPMLAFMKNKKEAKSKGPKYPQYKGRAPEPNRYGIQPGYRWDGVDRGNGFEKKYFQSISKKKAVASEAYKWSTEDM